MSDAQRERRRTQIRRDAKRLVRAGFHPDVIDDLESDALFDLNEEAREEKERNESQTSQSHG